jgi:archaellum component FlaC
MKDSQIDDLVEKVKQEASGLEKLLDKIPGYGGYRESNKRREADSILRNTISNKLEGIRLQLSGVHQELSRDIIKAMDHAEPLGEVDTRLRGLVSKIKDAADGYSGFMAAIKVDDDDLARVYAFDSSMMDYVDEISDGVNAVSEAVVGDGDIAGTIRALNNKVKEANQTFAERDDVLKGIS